MTRFTLGEEIWLNGELFGVPHCWERHNNESGVSVRLAKNLRLMTVANGGVFPVTQVFVSDAEASLFETGPLGDAVANTPLVGCLPVPAELSL